MNKTLADLESRLAKVISKTASAEELKAAEAVADSSDDSINLVAEETTESTENNDNPSEENAE
jgi:hypothetical protein